MEQMFFPVTQKKASQTGTARSSAANKNALFPTQLRKLRKEKGVSQDELSKILGVSKSTLGLWETGDTLPDARSLHDLAVYYGVSADYLLGLSDVQTANMDVKAICEYTGLTEKALSFFHDGIADRDENGVYPAGFTDDMYSPKKLINDIFECDIIDPFFAIVEFCDGMNDAVEPDSNLRVISDVISDDEGNCRGRGIAHLTFKQFAELKIEHAKSTFSDLLSSLYWKYLEKFK